jgi:hypothetical protein
MPPTTWLVNPLGHGERLAFVAVHIGEPFRISPAESVGKEKSKKFETDFRFAAKSLMCSSVDLGRSSASI